MTISPHSSAKGRLTRPAAAVILALLIFGAQAGAQVGANGEIDGLTAKFIDVNGIRTRYYDYGEGEPIPLTADPKVLLRVLGTEAGENVILNLTIVDGKDFTRKAMVKEVQVDPVTGKPLHADFLAISMERPI